MIAETGQYMTFKLGNEIFAIGVGQVREVLEVSRITRVPTAPAYMRGVVNVRGQATPVVDLRLKFGLAEAATTERTCIVVVQVRLPSGGSTQMGLVVDDVEEVLNITPADIEETPDFGSQIDTRYILGMAKIKGSVKALLDIDRVISGEVVETLAEIAA